jgi:hypothetical protein
MQVIVNSLFILELISYRGPTAEFRMVAQIITILDKLDRHLWAPADLRFFPGSPSSERVATPKFREQPRCLLSGTLTGIGLVRGFVLR